MSLSAAYIDVLESWKGVPYAHQGHTRTGCDCVGLVRGVYSELGCNLSEFDRPDRPYMPNVRLLIRGLHDAFEVGGDRSIQIGSVAIILDSSRMGWHCGLIFKSMGQLWTLEADRARGMVVTRAHTLEQLRDIFNPTAEQSEQLHAGLLNLG